MSERKMPSTTDSARKSRRVVEPYQPVWMAHWMRPQGNIAAEGRNHSAFENEEFNHVPRNGDFSNVLDVSRPVKEVKAVESKVIGTVKSSENVMTCWPFTNHGQGTDNEGALRLELGHMVERGKAVDEKTRIQISSEIPAVNRGCNDLGEGTSKNPPDWVKIHSSVMDRSLAALKPSKEKIVGSSMNLQPCYDLEKHEFGKGKAVVSPLMMRSSSVSNNHLPNTNMRMLDEEQWCKHSDSTDLICEREMDSDLNKSLLLDVPSTSDHHLQLAGSDSFREMQKSSGIPLIPSQFIASEKTESKKSHYNFYSLQKLPNCVNDMETMRICTTMDSVEATLGGFPRFSKTTHSLLITKKTDANISKEVFRTAQLIADMNGNTPGDIRSLWPFSGQGNRGVKLQPLSSSSNSEEKINVEDAKTYKVTLKNESSADTDTMDVDFSKEESNHGADCYPSTKVDAPTSREIGHHWKKTGLPDINLELPALPAIPNSPENVRASSSRTQSLEIDMLLAHAEHPKRKSNPCLGDSYETDPIMRWVKRLKLRSPDSSSQGTEGPTLAENSSAEKVGQFFRKILDSGIASLEPTLSNHQSKESIPLDKTGCRYLPNYNEEPPANVMKEDRELLLSHAWIKRWLQNGSKTIEKKPETSLPSEPTSSKLAPDDVQDKPFPSIAAMALMGKALNGLQSCDLQKRGNFTVWDTEGILKNR